MRKTLSGTRTTSTNSEKLPLRKHLTDALTGSQTDTAPWPAPYPFAFKCFNCDEETTVERSDARDLALNPDSLDAVKIVLDERGRLQDDIDGRLFCPDCAKD